MEDKNLELLMFAILSVVSLLMQNLEAFIASKFFFLVFLFWNLSDKLSKSNPNPPKERKEVEKEKEIKRCVTCENELPPDTDSDQCPNCEIEDAGIAMVVED